MSEHRRYVLNGFSGVTGIIPELESILKDAKKRGAESFEIEKTTQDFRISFFYELSEEKILEEKIQKLKDEIKELEKQRKEAIADKDKDKKDKKK